MTPRIPKLIASSVVRGAQHGESHGGLYLIDIESGRVTMTLDWNRTDIDVSGRGGDRGLRGIAFHGDHVLVAANAQILVLDQDFSIVDSFTNPYLSHCHEISVHDSQLYLTTTGYDSILVLDLRTRRFTQGLNLALDGKRASLRTFNPESGMGPEPTRIFHLNSVRASAAGVDFCGLHAPGLMRTDGRSLTMLAPVPRGTHNAQLVDEAVLYNDTAADRVCRIAGGKTLEMAVPAYARHEILNIDRFESTVARPGFARGLCMVTPGLVAGGSSPSTISLYELGEGSRIATQNISMDVRNAIHGLAVWPF